MIPQPFSRAAGDRRLNQHDLRVLVYVYGELDWLEYRSAKLSVVSLATSVNKADVSRAMARLVEFGYLVRGPNDGRLHTFRLANPHEVGVSPTRQAA